MVSYQTMTKLAFEVAREKGAQFEGGGSSGPPANAQAIIRLVSELWQEDKQRLKSMTEAQARSRLGEEIEVR